MELNKKECIKVSRGKVVWLLLDLIVPAKGLSIVVAGFNRRI